MTTLLLSLTSLFFASWVVILKIKLAAYRKREAAIIDAVHCHARRSGGEWDHWFVQSVKMALKGEC